MWRRVGEIHHRAVYHRCLYHIAQTCGRAIGGGHPGFTYAAGAGCCVLLRKALAVAGAVVTGIGSQLNVT